MSDSKTLSAVDFLSLANEYVVARVDLATIGRSGVLYVRELTADEKADVLPRPKGKARVYRDQSLEIDWGQLSPEAATKFLKTCLVEGKDGADLAARFGANGHSQATAVLQEGEIVPMYDAILLEVGRPHLANEAIGKLPNAVVDLLVKTIRDISGLNEDQEGDDLEDQKKE